MAQKIELKDERPLQTFWLKNFKAVNTVASRIAEPDDSCFYDLTNAQPIGQANLHSIADAVFIHNFGSTRIYKDWAFNLNNSHSIVKTDNQEVIFAAGTDGSMWAYFVGMMQAPPNQDLPEIIEIAQPGTFSGTDDLSVAQYDNGTILFIDKNGYFFWTGDIAWSPGGTRETGITKISTPTAPSANGAPTQGQAIAVYNNMVWIAKGRTLYWSVPGTGTSAGNPQGTLPGYQDFTVAAGGGWDVITDSTLRSKITALFAANGYLYMFGETSVDVISGVNVTSISTATSGGATVPADPVAITTFQRQNITASVGTDQSESIISYGVYVFFANKYGAWQILGSTVMSLSSDVTNNYLSGIDGTWQYLDFNHYNDAVMWINRASEVVDWENSSQNIVQWQLDNYTPYLFKISAGCVESNNLLCAAFLVVRKNDPIMGSGNFKLMYQGYPNDTTGQNYKWWAADWTTDIGPVTHICQSFVDNAPALFGYITDPVTGDCGLYRFFANRKSAPSARMMTALWDFKDLLSDKQAIRAGIRVSLHGAVNPAMHLNLDTLNRSYPVDLADIGIVDWVNATQQIVTWDNSSPTVAKWSNLKNFIIYWGQPQAAFSKCLGFTVTSERGTMFEMNSFLLDYKIGARWVGD